MSMFATITLSKSGDQALPAELDPKAEGLIYGQDLPMLSEVLDDMARELQVRPISEFFDDSEMLSEEEMEEMGIEPKQVGWFDAEEGLQTINALIAELEKRGSGGVLESGGRRYAAEVPLWDLRVSQSILNQASKSGEQFKFNVG